MLRNNEVNLTFGRCFGSVEIEEWQQLLNHIRDVQLQEGSDVVTWGLEKNGNFTTASLYRKLTFPGMTNKEVMRLWKAKIPMKINFFFFGPFTQTASLQQSNLSKETGLGMNFAKCVGK